jgi:hypothetical protein
VDTNVYRITFDKPVDTTFIASDTLDVNISVYDQADALMPRLAPTLTVRTLGGAGSITLVNNQRMIDNRDGTYSFTNIDLSRFANTNLEIRVNLPAKRTIIDNRINIFHGAAPNPAGANAAWKITHISPLPTISADSTTVISVNLRNEAGALWASQLMIVVQDSNGAIVVTAQMPAGRRTRRRGHPFLHFC